MKPLVQTSKASLPPAAFAAGEPLLGFRKHTELRVLSEIQKI